MSKGLEALKEYKRITCPNCQYHYLEEKCNIICFSNIIEKELKALEIIKNKEINVHALFLHLKRFDKPDGYNVLVGTKYQITQEEYDLLKEVLL